MSKGGRYTKHIYIGSQRIVSKLGDLGSFGADPRRVEYAGANSDVATIDYQAKYNTQQGIIKARYDTLKVPYNGKNNDDYVNGKGFCCDESGATAGGGTTGTGGGNMGNGNDNPELYQYYYHSDHLGSSSFITNLDGEVAQHIEYVPFGEVFIEERNNNWNTPYKFNGKELDEETGLYYYGARYMDPKTSLWISVDPKLENAPGWTPYRFCFNNPIRYTDPTGLWEGDYYDRDGKWLYNDNKNDNKVYVVDVLKHVPGRLEYQGSPGPEITITKEIKGVTKQEFIDMAAIAYGESSGDEDETFAFCNTIKNNMDAGQKSETSVTAGNFSYEKSNNTARYSGLKNSNDKTRSAAMQVAIAGAINALTGGFDYSNGALGWDGIDVLQGSPNAKMPNNHNPPENHYRQTNGGIRDPDNLATTFYNNARGYAGQRFGVGGREYNAVQPLKLNKVVEGKSPYVIKATYGASVFYDHR